MATIRVADDGGDEMMVYRYNNLNFPNFHQNPISKIPFVKIRSDDIFICAYPKSGTHWVWEITRLLLQGELDKTGISKVCGMIDLLPEEDYKDLPSPRVLNTHLVFGLMPEEVKVKKPKIIYLTRNPKDVTVSYYNFAKSTKTANYNGKWENYFRPCLDGKCKISMKASLHIMITVDYNDYNLTDSSTMVATVQHNMENT